MFWLTYFVNQQPVNMNNDDEDVVTLAWVLSTADKLVLSNTSIQELVFNNFY